MRFVLKAYLKNEPFKTVMVIFIVSVLILAYLVRLFELPFLAHKDVVLNDTSLYKYFNSVWLIVITVTSVGYGDVYPHTIPGKVVIMFVALYGAFLLSIIVLAVHSVFDLTDTQMQAMEHIHMTRAAARTIMVSLKYFKAKKAYYRLRSARTESREGSFMRFVQENPDPEEILENNFGFLKRNKTTEQKEKAAYLKLTTLYGKIMSNLAVFN